MLSGVDGGADESPKAQTQREGGRGQRKDPGVGDVAFASWCTQDVWTFYSTVFYDLLGPCMSVPPPVCDSTFPITVIPPSAKGVIWHTALAQNMIG